MALIVSNIEIAKNIYKLTVKYFGDVKPGQFFMLHLGELSMGEGLLLPRPISVFDYSNGRLSFVYRIVGRGTKRLSEQNSGDIRITGPLGNGFMLTDAPTTLIGGGLGIAPLYYLAKTLAEKNPSVPPTVHLGYSSDTFLLEDFKTLNVNIQTNIGGRVTDDVDFSKSNVYYTCGPEVMMRAAKTRALALCTVSQLYVSLERRMGCGVGACYACSVKTINGNRRVCKDGPVFLASEVFND